MGFVESLEHNQSYRYLVGILLNHARTCDNGDCVCPHLLEIINEKNIDYLQRTKKTRQAVEIPIARDLGVVQAQLKMFDQRLLKTRPKWRFFIKNVLQEGIGKFQKKEEIHLLMSYLEFFMLGNPFLSLSSCSIAKSLRPSFKSEFFISHQK